jgi:hypothetical protein
MNAKHWAMVMVLGLSAGCASQQQQQQKNAAKEEENEKNEVKMSINDVPADVRASLMKEANGAAIKTVDKEERNGQTVYEADAMVNGKNWEIVVDGNGKVVSKKLDNEADEKPAMKKTSKEKEEDEEKEEKEEKAAKK